MSYQKDIPINYDYFNRLMLRNSLLLTDLTDEYCINLFDEIDNAIEENNFKFINDAVSGINYRFRYFWYC